MVRICIVCKRTDQEILCHRFPNPVDRIETWRQSLQATDVDVITLKKRFTVCTLHFAPRDYRNAESRMLNVSAVPTLETFDKTPFYTRPSVSIYAKKASLSSGNVVPNSSTLHNSEQRMELHSDVELRKEELCKKNITEEMEYGSGSECSEEDAESPMRNRTKQSEYLNAFTQTEPVKFLTVEDMVQDEIIAEFYPDYVCRSKLTLIKELKELKAREQNSTYE